MRDDFSTLNPHLSSAHKDQMIHGISDELLARCSEFVTARFGLHFPRKRWRDLERGVVCAAREFGFKDATACIGWLVSGEPTREELGILAGCLTIGETYFFRETGSFDALESEILPQLIGARRGKDQRLRIWSAGCATGEEPYSVAMLLKRMIADLSGWHVTILATDVNADFLRRAERGVYGDWSFRGVPHWVKERYFTRTPEGKYEISAAIRKMVTFAPLNLADDPYPSLVNNTNAMDLILCRNVLMYFAPRQMKTVVGKFRQSLVASGWLVVSPCETSHALFPGFEAVSFPNAVFYRKDDQGKKGAAPLSMPMAVALSLPQPEDRPGVTPLPPVAPAKPASAPNPVREAARQTPSLYDEAQALYRQGLYADAAAKLKKHFAAGPEGRSFPAKDGDAAVLLARILANQGDFPAALEWAAKAIASDRLDPEAHYLQAQIFQEQEEDDAAAASLKRALYLDQTFVLAHFALANLCLRRGKSKEAARHLENAASLLHAYGDDDILPGSEGMSARRFAEIVATTMANTNG